VSRNEDIKFIQLRYTDVPGRFLAKYIAKHKEEEIEDLYKYGIGFDGSSVRGFAEINESDLMLIPDKSTRTVTSDTIMLPGYTVTSVIADIYKGFGQGRLSKDPRYVSECLEEHLEHKGLVCQIGAEVECFIFDDIILNDPAGKNQNNDEPKILSVEK
jgi:glutamine synthetase